MADLTPKQEAFALAYLETGNAAAAYRRAYDVAPDTKDGWLYVEACQLLDNPKVALRLSELQEQAAKLSLYSVKAAFEDYGTAQELAQRLGNPSAFVAAVNGKVKLFGLEAPTKTKTEMTGPDGGPLQTETVVRLEFVRAKADPAKDAGSIRSTVGEEGEV